MSITGWPLQPRLRERLIKEGPQALSDAELLAIFRRVGVAGKSAVELARDMISHFDSLSNLFGVSLGDFRQVNGLGPAKFSHLQAGALLNALNAVKEYL